MSAEDSAFGELLYGALEAFPRRLQGLGTLNLW